MKRRAGAKPTATPGEARFDDPEGSKKKLAADIQELKAEKSYTANITVSNIFWLMACYGVVHKFDIVDAMLYDDRINREYLNTAVMLLVTSWSTGAFCALVLERIFGVDYEKKVPWAVPLATITGLIGFTLLWMSVWPVWRWMTFIIMPSLFMGFIVALIFIPL